MLDPQGRLYGSVRRELIGTLQDCDITIDDETPLHKVLFEMYVKLSLKRI